MPEENEDAAGTEEVEEVEGEEESSGMTEIPRMDDDGIREFTDALLSGNVFTSSQAPENMVGTIFMPLMMGGASHIEPVIDDVGCLYEYLDQALPQGVNGYPMFPSFSVMHKDDWAVVIETYNYEKVRRDTMPVIRRPKEQPDAE